MTMDILTLLMQVISFAATATICVKYVRLRKQKENEYYTDFYHNNLILRVYKPEFEYQAVGKVPIDKILDRGTFSQFYLWVLLEK